MVRLFEEYLDLTGFRMGVDRARRREIDTNGNIDWIKDFEAGVDPQNPQVQRFTYDTLDRLTSAVVTGGTDGQYNETYTYDPSGRFETKNDVTWDYGDAAHVNAVTSTDNGTPTNTVDDNLYVYDANGNQIKRDVDGQTFVLEYDAENRLVKVCEDTSDDGVCQEQETIGTFTYDGDGARMMSVIDSVTTRFVGNHYEVTGSVVTKYYYAGGSRMAMRKDGTLNYILSDHLGSTSLVTDSSGFEVSELRYTAWGEVRYESGTTPTEYTYTGQYSNVVDFGLMYYNARWYDISLGRFAQADTDVPASQGVQGFDRFAYVNNNPIRYNDPSGHWFCEGENGGCLYPRLTQSQDGQAESHDQTDITEWLAKELDAQVENVQQFMSYCYGGLDCPFVRLGDMLGSHLTIFGNFSRYDIKRKMLSEIGEAVVLCGKDGCSWVDYSTSGNIMYGYLSAKRGMPQEISWIAGGILESLDNGKVNWDYVGSWFDHPGDKAAVDFGYSLYNLHPTGISVGQFQTALSQSVLDSFQPPPIYPSQLPLPQANTYPPGYFLNP